jgi:hypothetical protein
MHIGLSDDVSGHVQAFDMLAGEPGSITLAHLYDWRQGGRSFWHGEFGPLSVGTYGGDRVLVLMTANAPNQPCPVCSLVGGFHDEEWHDAVRRIPRGKVLPSGDSKRARVRLSAEEIEQRRADAAARREGGTDG